MAKTLHITVKDKVATYRERDGFIVCGNSDYVIEFTLDSEWDGYNTKTARFIYNGSYEDVVFTGNTVEVPIVRNTDTVAVGVFSGDLKTTTSAIIGCYKSILCSEGVPFDPAPDVYTQIMELLNAGGGGSGVSGKDGVSPTIAVSDSTNGYLLTITDVNGTKHVSITNGKDGKDGKDGINGTNGTNGTNGVSPTISVMPISGGHRVYVTDANGTQSFSVMDGKNGSGGSADTDELEQRIETLENQLYEPIAITSFSTSPAYFEKGSTVNALTLNWETNKTPLQVGVTTSMPLREDELRLDATSLYVDWISANVTNPVSFGLTVTDEKGSTARDTVNVKFYNSIYYGASAEPTEYNSAFILGLTKELRANKKPSFTVNAGTGQYIYYCLPVGMGVCSFAVGGFTGGFSLVDTISFANASGYTENYYIYRSDNANLGNTSVAVL